MPSKVSDIVGLSGLKGGCDITQITKGLIQKYGAERIRDTPITEVTTPPLFQSCRSAHCLLTQQMSNQASAVMLLLRLSSHAHIFGVLGTRTGLLTPKRVAGRLYRNSCWGGNGRASASLRVHDIQLCYASHRPDHQLGRKDTVHVGGNHFCPYRISGAQWRSSRRCCPALTMLCCLVQFSSRSEGTALRFLTTSTLHACRSPLNASSSRAETQPSKQKSCPCSHHNQCQKFD